MGTGLVLSSSTLPIYGEYHIPLKMSNMSSLIGLKSMAEGKNYDLSSNCIYWNSSGIYKNGVKLSNEEIQPGILGISVRADGQTMMV